MDNNYEKLYGKDNNSYHKSKDSSKCVNTNININGNNTGDINLGNNGQVAPPVAAERDSSASSFGRNGEIYDGYNKKDKGFVCIINNNNTNFGGNKTDGDRNKTVTCEEYFIENLGEQQFQTFLSILNDYDFTLGGFCEFLTNPETTNQQKFSALVELLFVAGISEDSEPVFECLEDIGLIELPVLLP